ncbi:efflux RND transporter permease subunit [Silvibacterium dinghuense]|uniref:Efflux RND transporter permease subunit n=1 Tax=Silvibacterium dinghuense TaxID=1560006 RepID=A0A4Q1S8Q1_9BACT|nr:efflux RND transporter permease subunit [Silvibacterium dinghuense]RXS93265.1 efflux RND transporter permease subunit [Silvibacterium dinghuense]GGH04426.1 acriflavine resistance protein B [Silvibacterium dinghuense]
MPKFALKYPFFIIMLCLMVMLVGFVGIASMPVDLFPKIDMPVVVVATFYNGMPPKQIEADITNTFERFFTLAANVDHSESRSLTGVSLIKIYFKPGTNADAALSNIANLAMADLRRLPPGTLPPVVLGMDASTQPVCLVTLKGKGLGETQLKDLAQFQVRNQISNVPGASVPQPYGGTYRQIQIYVDPLKMEARNLSLNDVVQSVNSSNLILPAGDVRIGSKDFNIYANSQFPDAKAMNEMPLKSVGNSSVLVADIGKAEDAGTLQYNIVRIDGQRSVYVPVFKQGGDSNTITIVNGMKDAIKKLVDIPETLKTSVVFDQSIFVKMAVKNLIKEASIGLVLTGLMIFIFLGSPRATFAVLLSIPLSALVCLLLTKAMGGSINTMILGGLALAFSRLIDDSVVVLENIFRFMEMGCKPREAAEKGGMEVSLAVLAATSTTSIVFFPVTFLSGISKYIFTPLALGVVLSIFASYFFAMTVVPLFCANFIRIHHGEDEAKKQSFFARFERGFNNKFQKLLDWYEGLAKRAMRRPGFTTAIILGGVVLVLAGLLPFLGRAYFPRTDPGQFVIDVQMPSGTRLEVSNDYIARVENVIRSVVKPSDLGMIVSNIGVYPDLSAIFTTNASMDTAFVQTSLKEDHRIGSYEYMRRVREKLSQQMPELSTYFQAGGLVDGVINQGLPAPIDVQISSNNMESAYALAKQMAEKIKAMPNVSDVYIPQNLDYPGIELNIDRERASLIGLSAKDVVDNVITAMTSDGQVAPSYWIDPKTGNNYMVTVQYANHVLNHMTMEDFRSIPLRGTRPAGYAPGEEARQAGDANPVIWAGDHSTGYTPLSSVADIKLINTPTEVDHYQIRRVIDIYVATKKEALQGVGGDIQKLLAQTKTERNTVLKVRGAVVSMNRSFAEFGLGLIISVLLVYLILMAQFTSFIDPFIILMAIPPGLAGVVLILFVTGSTLNIMSLMGVIMMTGIVVSNSILIVEFAGILHSEGLPLLEAVIRACRVRLRPILMTSLATLLGMIPMALGLEAGSEQYAPLARAIIGGLGVSVVVTVFLVPAVYLLIHGRQEKKLLAEGRAH